MKKVLFVVNYIKTETFYGISRYMDAEIHWLASGDPEWTEWLKEKGVAGEKILDAGAFDFSEEPDFSLLKEIEENSVYKVSAMITADRLLSLKSRDFAYRYVHSVYKNLKKYIIDNDIKAVFGESTWTLELLGSAAAKVCGIKYCTPATTRVFSNRYAFFEGCLQDRLLTDEQPSEADYREAEKYYEEFVSHKPVPDYTVLKRDYSLITRANFSKFMKHFTYFLKYRDRDMTRPDLNRLFEQRIFRRNNRKRLNRLRLSKDLSMLEGQKYCVYNLHVQPEASVDILGLYSSDQFGVILDISRSLPADVILVVKEHPQGVGDRVREFYNAVNDLPNTMLVSPYSDNWALMENAFAVMTVSGTSSFQAALLGIPSVIFSDMFFGELPNIHRCRCREELPDIMEKCLNADRTDVRERCTAFLAKLYRNSYSGSVLCRQVSESNISEKNFRTAAAGFNAVLKSL